MDEELQRLLEAARAAELLQSLETSSPPPAQPQQRSLPRVPEGWQQIGTAGEYRILQRPDGSLNAVGPGVSTSDPEEVRRIMEGAANSQVFEDRRARDQAQMDETRIAENPVAARANEVIRGTPFVGSYADEAVGLVSPQARDNMRATTEAMQRQRPGQTAALNIGGAIAAAIPMAVAAAPSIAARAPATLGGQFVAGLTGGAVAGATEGAIYGSGEGTTGEERRSEATRNALIGAGAGGVFGAVAPYAGAGMRAVLRRLQGSDTQVIARQLGVSPTAAQQIRLALDNSDIDAAEAVLTRAGDQAMLGEATVGTRQLLDATAQVGGPAGQTVRTAVRERTDEATQRITRALDQTLGQPRGSREIIDQIRNEARPVLSREYETAYAAPIDYSAQPGRNIEALLNRVPASAWRRAEQLMSLEGVESAQRLVRIEGDRAIIETLPDVRQLDYITRALNDVAQEADGQGALGGTTDLGRLTGNLSRMIRSNLREAVPEYGQALESASAAIQQRGAAELGYTMFRQNVTREDVARALSDATGPERRAAREGLRAYIDDTTARVTRTLTDSDVDGREAVRALRDLSSRSNQTKLRILLGQEQADRLLSEIDQAATAFELRAAINENSKTAVRQAVQSNINEVAQGGMVRSLTRGEGVNATKNLIQALSGETTEAQQLRAMGIYQEIAQALTQTSGDRARTALRTIQAAMARQQPLSEAQARIVTDVLVGGALTANRAASTLLPTR